MRASWSGDLTTPAVGRRARSACGRLASDCACAGRASSPGVMSGNTPPLTATAASSLPLASGTTATSGLSSQIAGVKDVSIGGGEGGETHCALPSVLPEVTRVRTLWYTTPMTARTHRLGLVPSAGGRRAIRS